jgi:PGF-pre-PGF domain-containing protein/PGF-CTERM protein
VIDSYATGAVDGSGNDIGGLVGDVDFGGAVENSYWDINTTNQSTSAGDAVGLTTAEMTGVNATQNMAFDFGGPWYLTPEYPELTEYEHRGEGTDEEPYKVGNVDELQLMKNDLTASYVLTEDVDASETKNWNSGAGFEPVGYYDSGSDNVFTGTFDGDDHRISDLYIDRDTEDYVGLFGLASGAEFERVGLENVEISADDYVGGLAGSNNDGGVTETYVTGAINGRNAVGGLIGRNLGANVTDSYATGTVDGEDDVGGLVGRSSIDANIIDSHATVGVNGERRVGGLVGSNDGSDVTTSYATGEVDGTNYIGGLVGDNSGTVEDAYWDTETTNQSDSAGGTGLTTAQMTGANATAAGNMDGLDYEATWLAVDDKDTYPVLGWQVDTYDLSLADTVEVGSSTGAMVDVTLDDGTQTTATETSTYTSEGNVSVDAGTVTGESYGFGTVTAMAGGVSDTAGITALDSDFQVDLVDVPTNVDAGETYTFNASVENVGNDEGTKNVSLVFNGTEFYNDSVTLAAGTTKEIAVDYEIPDIETGTVDLDASTPNDEATTTVDVNGNETVTGRVVDGATGEALSNLTVTVDDGSTAYEAETNETGIYELAIINGRTVTVSVTATVDGAEGSEEITGEATETVSGETDVNLELWPELDGSGTEQEPYNISTARELAAISQNSGANYTLVGDVDASETDQWQPAKWQFNSFRQSDATGFLPVYLSGSLDGNGHTITNITIFTDGDAAPGSYVGLFDSLANGQLSNLSVENATATESTGSNTGLLVASVTGESTIKNVRVTGTASSDNRVLGGVVGYNGGEIHNTSANVSLGGEATYIGGLVGDLNQGTVNTSFAVGSIDGTGTLGGLVGRYTSGTVKDSYWDSSTTTQSTSAGGGTGLTTANMTGLNATQNMALDFESTWAPTTSYPVHRFDEANTEAVFAVRSVDLPDYVAVDDMLRPYNATLENVGTASGSKELSLSVAGITSRQSVTLAAGSTESVMSFFSVPTDATSGTYDAVITTPDDELTDTVDIRSRETLLGTVIDGVTGEPLSDVPVTVDYDTDRQEFTRTDADGTYSVDVVNGTEITVSATTTAAWVGEPEINTTEMLTVDGEETVDLDLWSELEGEGTESTPYNVSNVYELQTISQDPGANYTLVADVDASETKDWNEGKGFEPIGTNSERFEGTINGNGHTISNLAINRSEKVNVGLFGVTVRDSTIENVGLVDVDIHGDNQVGGLAGFLGDGATVSESYVTGTVDGNKFAGGLVGYNYRGTVSESYATGAVEGTETVGGLVGENFEGTVSESYATGTVDGTNYVGGLVGNNDDSDAIMSYATGEVNGTNYIGGLIGDNSGTVDNAYWDIESTNQSDSAGGTGLTTAQMTGVDADSDMDLDFGGPWYLTPEYPALAEYEHAGNGTDDDPYEIGTVDELQLIENNLSANYTLTREINANETVAWNDGAGFEPIGADSPQGFSGSFDGAGLQITGLTSNDSNTDYIGLFSSSSGRITNVTLSAVDITGYIAVGGVAGSVDGGTVRNVSVSGEVEGVRNAGLLLGESTESTVVDSSANGTTTASGEAIGGLIGYSSKSTVRNTTASGTVDGGTYVGGLVGWNGNIPPNSGAIERSSASATVVATESGGGLVGRNGDANVTDSYATGSVTGGDLVGGLIGTNENDGNVSTSYAIGAVDGNSGEGGLIGDDAGTGAIVDAYWNTETTGQQSSAGSSDAAGLATDQMQTFAPVVTMPGFFDDSGTWIVTNEYPALAWQNYEELTVDALGATNASSTAGEPGTITVTATTEEADIGQGVTLEVTDNDSLTELDTGATAMTDANGTVTFEFNETAPGDYEPTFAWADAHSINDTATVTVNVAAATSVGVGTQPAKSTVGEAIDGPPAAIVTDTFGNPVADADVTVSTVSGEPFDGGTTTRSTDSAGVATFDDLSIEIAGNYRLQFEINSFDNGVDISDTAESNTFDVLGADADSLIVISAPEMVTAGNGLTLSIRLTDEFGNPAVNQTLDGLTVDSEFDGTVFESQSVQLNGTGEYEIQIPAGELTTANKSHTLTVDSEGIRQDSVDIAVEPAAADGLVFVTQPDDTVAGETISNESGPLEVVILDAYDNVVDDAANEVTLSATTGSGTLAGETTVAATDGRAKFSDLSIQTVDAYRLEAVADGVTTAESEAFEISPAAVDSVSLDPATDRALVAGETVEFNATAVDAFGNTIETTATAFSWQNTTASGIFEQTVTGAYTVTAEYGDVTADPVAVTVTTADVSTVTIDPDSDRTITAGDDLDFSATARDSYGNVIDDDSRFSWANTMTTGSFTATAAGRYTVTATLQDTSSNTVNVTVDAGNATSVGVATQPTESTVGDAIAGPPAAAVTDAFGNPVAGVEVTISTASGEPFDAGTTTRSTDSTGVATFDDLIIETAGNYRLQFGIDSADAGVDASDTVETENFDVLESDADRLTVVSSPETTAAGDGIILTVRLEDEFGNPAANQTVTGLTVDSEFDGTVFEWGSVGLNETGQYELTITAGAVRTANNSHSLTVDADGVRQGNIDIAVDPAAADTLNFRTQPDTTIAGQPITNSSGGLAVEVRDSYGNLVEESTAPVTLAVETGDRALIGETTETASDGIAEFSNISIETADSYRLRATSDGLAEADSEPFTISPGTVETVRIDPPTGQTITAGDEFAFRPTARDSYGNLVTDNASRFNWENTTAGGVFESTVVGTYTVIAAMQQTTSNPVAVTVEPGAVAILVAPNVTETAGVEGTLRVTATDGVGNPVTDELITVSDAGGLTGLTISETNRTSSDGVATFEFIENSSGEYMVGFETDADGTVTTTMTVTIERAAVDTLNVSVADSSLTTGESTQLTALATFSNGTSLDVTNATNLTTNDSSVVTVDANRTVTAEGPGQTNLTATFEGVTKTIGISVSNPSSDSSGGSNRPSPGPTPPIPSTLEPVVDTETDTNGSETTVSVEDAVAGTPVSIRRADGQPLARSGSTSVDELSITTDTDRDFSVIVRSTERLVANNPEGAVDLSIETDGSTSVGYLTIDHDLGTEITTATITFSVATDEIDAGDVQLYRNVDGEWTPLDTRLLGQADGRAQYEATTPGFSAFAIGVDEPTDTDESTDADEPIGTDEPADSDSTTDDAPGFGLLAGVIALLGVALILSRRD